MMISPIKNTGPETETAINKQNKKKMINAAIIMY